MLNEIGNCCRLQITWMRYNAVIVYQNLLNKALGFVPNLESIVSYCGESSFVFVAGFLIPIICSASFSFR